jgi:hypothetical protein
MPDGSVQIVAGGKRLRALQKLAAEGWHRTADQRRIDYVPVQITEDPLVAQAWAGAENTARSALHPADEIRAYAALRLTGISPGTIARTYAVTESQVHRMLKLACSATLATFSTLTAWKQSRRPVTTCWTPTRALPRWFVWSYPLSAVLLICCCTSTRKCM